MFPTRPIRFTALLAALAVTAIASAAAPADATLEANKKVAIAFYEAAINNKDYEAATKFLGPFYKQHNPTAQDGAEGLKGFIDFLKERFPTQKGEIKRVIAEGDLVVLHVHSTRGDNTPGRAIVDIFRVQNGKVVEHWDVIQDIPEKPVNNNGMF
ncbi:MAG: ester cyclase [Nevskiaceae bacterium]|jgi:predicted SnoaL-like aldol condensation-catalyzing enzyme|nr:ester cyclase [Nevskiaceae bacterium]